MTVEERSNHVFRRGNPILLRSTAAFQTMGQYIIAARSLTFVLLVRADQSV